MPGLEPATSVPTSQGADELRLAERAVAGDGRAFAALYDRYESRIFNFCHRITGSEEDAADATQDAFMKMFEKLPSFEDRELNFGAYLFTVARHSCYRIVDRRKRAEPTEEISDLAAFGQGGAAMPDPGDPEEDPERKALLESQQDEIRSANERLPERQREVLVLRELEEMSYEQIGEIMEMNSNAVAQLISRARIRLRDELRGSALASVTAATPDCERALPLMARRQDGKLDDGVDAAWLEQHLAGCETCRLAVDAMAEAGVSYRAWLPIVPLVWLREAAIAQAAERTGADWSEIAARGRGDGAGAHGAIAGGYGAGKRTGAALTGAAGHLQERIRRMPRAVFGAAMTCVFLMALLTLAGGSDGPVTPRALPAPAATDVPDAPTADVDEPARKRRVRRARRSFGAGGGVTAVPDDEGGEPVRPPSILGGGAPRVRVPSGGGKERSGGVRKTPAPKQPAKAPGTPRPAPVSPPQQEGSPDTPVADPTPAPANPAPTPPPASNPEPPPRQPPPNDGCQQRIC